MQIELQQESPLVGVLHELEHIAPDMHQRVRIQEIPFLELTNIRGNSNSPEFIQVVEDVIGVAPPTQPNTIAETGTYVLWWLGPDEWLAQSRHACPATLENTLRNRLGDQFASCVDVSSGYTVLRLSGTNAGDVLQKGCPLDLHPSAFAQEQCAQSLFFKAAVALRMDGDGTWIVVVRRSFADYVVRMLLDAAWEFYL